MQGQGLFEVTGRFFGAAKPQSDSPQSQVVPGQCRDAVGKAPRSFLRVGVEAQGRGVPFMLMIEHAIGANQPFGFGHDRECPAVSGLFIRRQRKL